MYIYIDLQISRQIITIEFETQELGKQNTCYLNTR